MSQTWLSSWTPHPVLTGDILCLDPLSRIPYIHSFSQSSHPASVSGRYRTLKASPHRLTALAAVEPPATVHGLHPFIGAYKVLSRVLKGYSAFMDPLDRVTAGRQSRENIEWSEDLLAAFKLAQTSLKDCKPITIPHPDDCLWIVTDASVRE